MTVEIFPPWSNRFRLPEMAGGFPVTPIGYKAPQFVPDSQYGLPTMEQLLEGTGWSDTTFGGVTGEGQGPLIVEDDYGDYPDANRNRLENGNPPMEWEPPRKAKARESEVMKGIVVADVSGVATTTVEVSLPDAGGSVLATMLFPDGLTWDQVNPQYKQDDVIMVFHTPDDQWFAAGGFHSTASGMFRARTTAAWDGGLTTTATLYLQGDTLGTPTGSTVTVTFLETYSVDNYPPIGIDKEIAIFQDVDDDWTCPQLFFATSPLAFLTDWYLSGDDIKVKSRVINVLNPQSEVQATQLTTQTLTFLTDIYKHPPTVSNNKAYNPGDASIGGIRKDYYTTVRVLGADAKTEDVQAVPFDAKHAGVTISYDAGSNTLSLNREQWLILSDTTSPVTTSSSGIGLVEEDLADNIQYTAGSNLLNLTTRKVTVFEAAAGTPSVGINLTNNDVATDVVFTDGTPATLKCVTRTIPTFEWSAGTGTSTGINLVKDDLGDDIVYDSGSKRLKLTTREVTSFLFAAGTNSTGASLTARIVAYDIARSGNAIVALRKKVYTFDDDTEVNSTGVTFASLTSVFVQAGFGAGKIEFTTRNVYVFSDVAGTTDDNLTTTACP